jgi:acyl carrier protein
VTAELDQALRQRVLEAIFSILDRVLDHPLPAIADGTDLRADLGLRSATTLQLLLELEDSLEIQIDIEEIAQASLTTIGDLADFVARQSLAG